MDNFWDAVIADNVANKCKKLNSLNMVLEAKSHV